jgi:hypothetical protein
MMKFSLGSTVAALGLLTAGQASAGIISFTDEALWLAALGGATVTTETFDGAASSFDANSTGNSIGSGLTLDLIGGVGDTGPTGLTGSGKLEFEVDSSSFTNSDGLNIRISGLSAMGFALRNLTDDSLFSPAVNLHEIGIDIGGTSFLISDVLGLTSGTETSAADAIAPFIGFVSSDSIISSFTFVHGDAIRSVSGGTESFFLEGLSVAAVESVPAPGTLALFGLGLAGLVWKRRK